MFHYWYKLIICMSIIYKIVDTISLNNRFIYNIKLTLKFIFDLLFHSWDLKKKKKINLIQQIFN